MTLMRSLVLAAALALPMNAALADDSAPPPLSWSQLQDIPLPKAGQRITYGDGPQQFGELRLPAGKVQKKGWPVMVMIHGGCWQAEYDYVYFTRLADWMTTQGFATWTIEYARLGDATGGWPGTFTDVGKATDALRMIAKTSPLDLHHVYAAGHSAGGQLALWLPSRNKLPKTSALYLKHPLPIRGVLGLAAITDLDTYRIGPEDSCHASVDPLLGGSPESFPERYAESSPLRRLPLGVPQVFIQGDKDTIVDPAGVSRYVDTAIAAGDLARILPLPGRGHFDTAVATPVSETALLDALKQLRR